MQTYEITDTLGNTIFTASLPNTTPKYKLLKLAVEQAIKAGIILKNAYLRYANLSGADLSGAIFTDADFRSANLTGADLSGAIFTDADLYGANLSDANLSDANLSGVDLRNADLSGAIFTGTDLHFADLCFADLRFANLTGVIFTDANLRDADFEHAILKDAILPDGVPHIPNLDKLIYEKLQLPENKLNMYNWHTCNTTHCRYGWAIHLAGEAGKDLEKKFEPEVAGALIYAKAYPELPIPPYTGDNEEVMADIKMRAGV